MSEPQPDIVERLRETACIPDGRGGTVWRPSIMEEAAKEIERLRVLVDRTRWQPISEIHEEESGLLCMFTCCDDPDSFHIGTNLADDFDERKWTHFVVVPVLSDEEAERLRKLEELREGD